MARSVENKLIHIPLNRGMDQSTAPEVAPAGTLYRVTNCRKRGPGGLLESRPGLSQLPSTCLGESAHYIAGDGTNQYVYRPSFITRIADSPMLGTTAGEAFCFEGSLWNFCGRFSTCLPIQKHTFIAPNLLAENVQDGTLFPPQTAVNQDGYVMTVAIDTNDTTGGNVIAYIDSPDGVRQMVQWSKTTAVKRVRLVALGSKFVLLWQATFGGVAEVSANTYVPAMGSPGIIYTELGFLVSLVSADSFWDAAADAPASAGLFYIALMPSANSVAVASFTGSGSSAHSTGFAVGSNSTPVALWVNPTTKDVWLGFNDTSDSLITGTDTNANVNTSSNKTLRIRADDSLAYTVITVTSSTSTAKTTIASDLNTAFSGASLALFASVDVVTHKLTISSTNTIPGIPGAFVQIDSTANGSTLNTAVGFASGGSTAMSGASYAIFHATLTLVLAHATIDATLGGLSHSAPLFGLYRGNTPLDGDGTVAFYAVGVFQTSGFFNRAMYVGTCNVAGNSQVGAYHQSAWPVSKPDQYQRIWVLIDSGIVDSSIDTNGSPIFAVSRYALLRFSDLTVDATDTNNIQLLSPPTVELVSDGYVSLSFALRYENADSQQSADYFAPIAVGSNSMYFPLWAGLAFTQGQAIADETHTQSAGTLVQAQVLQYTATELDEPSATHRDHDAIQQSVMISGQPVEIFGQSTAEIIYGITSGSASPAHSAGAAEVGFLHPPAIYKTANGSSSGTPATGTYQYKAVFQWVDAFGRRHLSAPSLPTSFVADGAHAVTVGVFTTQYTQRQSRNSMQAVDVVLYRTVAGGTQFHETTMRATLFDTDSHRVIDFNDDLTDDQIRENAFLYTDGGVLQNDIAPSCRFACRSDDRVWFGGLWDATILRCSKIIVPGEPIETPEADSFMVQLLRPCTGLSYMDGQLIAFAKDAIFLISGGGPNDQGNGDFSVRTLTQTIGCIDYRSIVETEAGTLFQSFHGIYMIPRGFSPPQYVGAPVQDLMLPSGADVPTEILAAAYEQNVQGSLAKFLLRGSVHATGGQIVLIMDTNTGEWFTDELGASARELGYLSRSSQLAIGPGSLYAAPDFNNISAVISPVLYETVTDRYDHPFLGTTKTAVSMEVQSTWLNPFGLAGWGRFSQLIGAFKTDTVGITYAASIQIDSNTVDAISWAFTDSSQLGVKQFRQVTPTVQKGTDAQLTLTIVPTDTTTAPAYTAKFVAATLEIDPSGGVRLLSSPER